MLPSCLSMTLWLLMDWMWGRQRWRHRVWVLDQFFDWMLYRWLGDSLVVQMTLLLQVWCSNKTTITPSCRRQPEFANLYDYTGSLHLSYVIQGMCTSCIAFLTFEYSSIICAFRDVHTYFCKLKFKKTRATNGRDEGGILDKVRPHLGKMRPIWAICTKSG